MVIYNRRKWISKETHSSGYVMCYYNKSCFNDELQFFIRIADCSTSFLLRLDEYSKKDINRFLANLQKLVSLEIKYFVFHQYTFKVFNSVNFGYLIVKENFRGFNRLVKKNPNIGKLLKSKELIRLHFDEQTCTQKQWQRKLNILKAEISDFHQFLLNNKILNALE